MRIRLNRSEHQKILKKLAEAENMSPTQTIIKMLSKEAYNKYGPREKSNTDKN